MYICIFIHTSQSVLFTSGGEAVHGVSARVVHYQVEILASKYRVQNHYQAECHDLVQILLLHDKILLSHYHAEIYYLGKINDPVEIYRLVEIYYQK